MSLHGGRGKQGKPMLNKTNIVGGFALILGGLGEIVSAQAICPLCIGAITGGAAMIANEFGITL